MKLLPLLLLTLAACTTEASLGNSGTAVQPTSPPSSLGSARWSVIINAGSTTHTEGLAFGRDGDVIAVGMSFTEDSILGFVTARANADGVERWTVQMSDSTQPQAVATDSAGNIYVTGTFMGDVDFGGQVVSSGGTAPAQISDLFVAKYSPSGVLIWVRSLGCTVSANGTAIEISSDGNLVVAGWFRGIVDVGAGPVGLGTGWELQGDGLLFGISAETGARTWGRTFSNWAPNDLIVLADGDVLVSGERMGSRFVERFDDQHELVWSRSIAVANSSRTAPFGIALVDEQLLVSSAGQHFGAADEMQLDALAPADGADVWRRNALGVWGASVAATPNGFVLAGEVTASTADFGTGPVGRPLFIASFAGDGEPAEARSVGTPAPTNQRIDEVIVNADGSVAYSGTHMALGDRDTELVLIDPP